MPRTKTKKEYNPELKGHRLYASTRKNKVVPRGIGGSSCIREVSASYTNPELKKKIIHRNLSQNFLSQFTFFPLYDCDNNSYIRLYRLHAQYKNKYKKKAKKIITTTEFGDCIRILNKYFFNIILREQEEIHIGKDIMFAFRKKNDHRITTQQSPVRFMWSVVNPCSPQNPQRLFFPKIKNLIGRPTFTDLKSLAKEFNTTTLLQDIPLFTETQYFKNNKKSRLDKKITAEFIEAEESNMDFNMFNDF